MVIYVYGFYKAFQLVEVWMELYVIHATMNSKTNFLHEITFSTLNRV